MRRFYQESWHGIPFTAFTHVSFFHLASSKFYASFYNELFRRYKSWIDLPFSWRKSKDKDALWIAEQIGKQSAKICAIQKESSKEDQELVFDEKNPRVLSIVRGVGYMEKSLLEIMPNIELHVNESTTLGMRWLRDVMPTERIYIGSPLTSLPSDFKYDVIYLAAVDYSIEESDLALILRELRGQLKSGGKLICISAYLLIESSALGRFMNGLKIGVRAILQLLTMRRQQFWGWKRTKLEYYKLFKNAGFSTIQDGYLENGLNSFWISGE